MSERRRGTRAGGKLDDRLLALVSASTLAVSSLDLDDVLSRILGIAMRLTSAEASAILLLAEKGESLTFRTLAGGAGTERLRTLQVPVDESLSGWVVKSGVPLRVDDVANDPRAFHRADQRSGFQTRSALVVPLVERGTVVGTVETLNKTGAGGFDDEDERLLVALANQAAAAIANSRAHARLLREKRLLDAILDSLGDGVVVTGPEGGVRLVNSRAREMFGVRGPGHTPDVLEVLLRGVAELEEGATSDIALLKPQGRILSNRVTSLRDGSGTVSGFVAALRDVTDAREGQRRRDVVFTVGIHDVQSALEALSKSLSADGAREAVLGVREQIEDLVRFSDIESGPIRLLRRRIELAELVRKAAASCPRAKLTAAATVEAYVDVSQLTHALEQVVASCETLTPAPAAIEIAIERRALEAVIRLEGTAEPKTADAAGARLDAKKQVEEYMATMGRRLDLSLAHARHILVSHGGRLTFSRGQTRYGFELGLPASDDREPS